MKVSANKKAGISLIGALIVFAAATAAGVGLVMVAKKVIDKGKTIQKNREEQLTNIWSELDAPYYHVEYIDWNTNNGALEAELTEEGYKNIVSELGEWTIWHKGSLEEEWQELDTFHGDHHSAVKHIFEVIIPVDSQHLPQHYYKTTKAVNSYK